LIPRQISNRSLPASWLRLSILLLLGACGVSGGAPATRDLAILYTADAQGYLKECACETGGMLGGIARRAALVDSLRKSEGDLLLLEAGDFATGPGPHGEIVGLVAARAMARMGYDAILPGEVELNLGAPFWEKVAGLDLPFVHTNFGSAALGPPARKAVVVERAGRRIAVLGLLGADLYFLPEAKESLQIDPPDEAARSALADLRRGWDFDLVVALVHMRGGDVDRLVERVPEIDLVVAGHTSRNVEEPERRGRALLVSAGFLGQQVGALRLPGGRLAAAENSLIRLEASLPEDEQIARWVGIAAPR
jgi:5'-nucleotidase